jgi:hypothetical protein
VIKRETKGSDREREGGGNGDDGERGFRDRETNNHFPRVKYGHSSRLWAETTVQSLFLHVLSVLSFLHLLGP